MSAVNNTLSRRGFLIASGGAMLAFAAACSSDSSGSGDGGATGATIEHKYGATEVPANPQRIVSVGYNDHDTVLALGGTLVGTFDWYGDYPGGLWPWAKEVAGGKVPEIVASASTGIAFEKVAVAAPDLIVATYSGLTRAEYDKLSAIAPTVAQPKDFADYGVPWQEQAAILGDALGQQQKAGSLVSKVEGGFATARTDNAAFAGKTVMVGALKGPGQFGVYGAEDPKVRFFTELGFVNPPVLEEMNANFAEISTEQLTLADVDLLVWYAGGGFGDKLRAELDKTPLYHQLEVVKDGRAIILEDEAAEAMTWSTVLSLPYALEEIPGRIAPLMR